MNPKCAYHSPNYYYFILFFENLRCVCRVGQLLKKGTLNRSYIYDDFHVGSHVAFFYVNDVVYIQRWAAERFLYIRDILPNTLEYCEE